jgi:hypothetical protein
MRSPRLSGLATFSGLMRVHKGGGLILGSCDKSVVRRLFCHGTFLANFTMTMAAARTLGCQNRRSSRAGPNALPEVERSS